MTSSFKILTILLIAVTFMYSCQKADEINLSPAFSANLNGSEKVLKSTKAVVNKGITIIAGSETTKTERSMVVITIRGAEKGEFKQDYDYITGVSVAQASCTYKIISKSENTKAQFYVSYEGTVEISDIDFSKRQISGSYKFDLKAIPNSKNKQKLEGDFVNLSF